LPETINNLSKLLKENDLGDQYAEVLAAAAALSQQDDDLARLIVAWPTLPDAVRRMMLAAIH